LLEPPPPTPPFSCADANNDGAVNLTDAIYVLKHLFQGGAPAPPFTPTALDVILKTGQTRCYFYSGAQWWEDLECDESFWEGQDGDYQNGVARNYQDIVFPKTNKTGVKDVSTNLLWEKTPEDPGTYTYPAAVSEAQLRNLDGDGGWRLPTVGEMLSILDFSRGAVGEGPALDPVFFILQLNFPDSVWTSTLYAPDSTQAWTVRISAGSQTAAGDTHPAPINDPETLYGVIAVKAVKPDVHGGPHPPVPTVQLGDSNGDRVLNISDPIFTLNFLF
jgi:hypothetical protein